MCTSKTLKSMGICGRRKSSTKVHSWRSYYTCGKLFVLRSLCFNILHNSPPVDAGQLFICWDHMATHNVFPSLERPVIITLWSPLFICLAGGLCFKKQQRADLNVIKIVKSSQHTSEQCLIHVLRVHLLWGVYIISNVWDLQLKVGSTYHCTLLDNTTTNQSNEQGKNKKRVNVGVWCGEEWKRLMERRQSNGNEPLLVFERTCPTCFPLTPKTSSSSEPVCVW